jgi:hypothetical protein
MEESVERREAPVGTIKCIWPERALDGYDDMLDAVENEKHEK